MKKLSLLALCLFIGIVTNAQNAKQLLGNYTVENAPFETIIISWENDKLYGEAVGQGKSMLAATDTPDKYAVADYSGNVMFQRNDSKIVTSLLLSMDGQEVQGTRNIPSLEDYEGHFVVAEGPISAIDISAENGVLMFDIPEMGKGPVAATSIIDQFYGDAYQSDITFTRNEENVVDGFEIAVQGMVILGSKDMVVAATPNPFIGMYEFDGGPLSELEVTAGENGDLFGSSDQGDGVMKKTEQANVFKLVDYDGEAVFQRNADGSVSGIILKVQGAEMMGSKR